jgi:cell division protein ZapA (FtsZ GTPase activity inhibitor)
LSEPARVELEILGHKLTLRSQAPAEYVQSLASYLEERVAMIKGAGARDATSALILAALDIIDELFRARDDVTRREHQVSARLGALVTMLEQVTPKSA